MRSVLRALAWGAGSSSLRAPLLTLSPASSPKQAPKEQKTKEAKALAAANSSKGKKKVGFVWALCSSSTELFTRAQWWR